MTSSDRLYKHNKPQIRLLICNENNRNEQLEMNKKD